MRTQLKKRILLASLLVALAGVLAVWFAPFLVGNGVRLWISWKARRQNLTVKIEKIEAPFLRPLVLRGVHVTSSPDAAFRIDLRTEEATVSLNLNSILLRMRGRTLRTLSVKGLRGEIHTNPSGKPFPDPTWKTWQTLLPSVLTLEPFDLRIENGSTVVLLRNGALTASEIESGRFRAGELMIVSPWLRQTYSDLRGATNWRGDRLTIAGLILTRGLDLQSITADLSRLRKQRIGVEFDLDAFGGKIRASISNEWRSRHSNWNMAGSASGISLAQTSDAIGFADRIDGTLHACKFTFRGGFRDAARSTASLWTELTGLTWRDRKADVIMLGVAFYNRQIAVQQLYVKQSRNELTLSGEASFPNASAWLSPDFRGNISASITSLGDFAALWGANPGDFRGKIAVEGTMNTRDQKIGGHLSANGSALTLFKTSIDTLSADLNLKGTELEIEHLELKRGADLLQAQGAIDMAHEHNYSGTLSAKIGHLAEYLSIFGWPAEAESKPIAAEIESAIESGVWDARGTVKIPDSKPVEFSARVPLLIGKDWNFFRAAPLNLSVDFPAISITHAPRLFRTPVFREGWLSGKLELTETLQHPRIMGGVQLTSAKFQNIPVNLGEMNAQATFNGDRAQVDSFTVLAKDVRVSGLGEIDFRDPNAVVVKVFPAEPVLDLASNLLDCANQIELTSTTDTAAPVVADLEFRGGIFQNEWAINLNETGNGLPGGAPPGGAPRKVPLCFGSNPAEKTLTLGVRSTAKPEKAAAKKRRKR